MTLTIASPGRDVWSARGMATPYYPAGSGVRDPYDAPDFWTFCVAKGVQAIKAGLTWHGVRRADGREFVATDGRMYAVTVQGVRDVQRRFGLVVDGEYGPQSARAMFAPWLRSVRDEMGAAVPFQLLAGIIDLESSWDPGGQGDATPADLGLEQKNTEAYDVGWDDPFDPQWAFTDLTRVRDHAWRRYLPGGASWQTDDLRRKCTVGGHWTPTGADTWWTTGVAPLPKGYTEPSQVPASVTTIEKYATAVLKRAAQF
jgi:Putative peptidoglycan binding domain